MSANVGVLFVSGRSEDRSLKEVIVLAIGVGADLIDVNSINALRAGLGRQDLVVVSLNRVGRPAVTEVSLLAQHFSCPMLCLYPGSAIAEFQSQLQQTCCGRDIPIVDVSGHHADWSARVQEAVIAVLSAVATP